MNQALSYLTLPLMVMVQSLLYVSGPLISYFTFDDNGIIITIYIYMYQALSYLTLPLMVMVQSLPYVSGPLISYFTFDSNGTIITLCIRPSHI